ncbi:MAG: DoxX family protein [Pseudonocardia sp. SCN 72-86]|nr:MAG: DoxX family protein [Pseudonocardia sp. SCN 72-86]
MQQALVSGEVAAAVWAVSTVEDDKAKGAPINWKLPSARWFGSIGFKQPELQAKTSAAVEIGAGAALIAGAGTPLAAAAVVGTMAVAARSVHAPNGFFITAEGYEYVLNLATASVALAGMGPGRFSVDRAIGADRKLRGPAAAGVAAGLGLAGAAAQLATFWRRPPSKRA